MPAVGIRWLDYNGAEHIESVESVMARAKADPFWKYPYPILAGMLDEEDTLARPTEGLSVTTLNYWCLRCQVLQKYEDYIVDLEGEWAKFRGHTYHSLLEKYQFPGSISEVRFYAPVPGVEGGSIHGKMDTVIPMADGTWTIADLKTTTEVPKYDAPYQDHVRQLQMYRYLVNHATRWDADLGDIVPSEMRITRLGLWYVDDKGPKPLEIRSKTQVPTGKGSKYPTKTVKVPNIWSDEECEAVLVDRYVEVAEAFAGYEYDKSLPPYPPGFDHIKHPSHRFKPTARMCVDRHYEDLRVKEIGKLPAGAAA